MKTNKVFYIASIVFIGIYLYPFSLSAQEDVSVEFSFSKPDTFVCKIKNKTDFNMDIWFDMIEFGSASNVYFDIIRNRKDTIRDCYYPLKTDLPYRVRLDPGQGYSTLFKDAIIWRFIKAKVFVKYSVILPTSEWEAGSYEKTFDLDELRRKAYWQPIKKNEEKSLSPQEDVPVEFSFSKPDTFVCEIKNKTGFKTDIWFYDLEHGPLTDVRCFRKDTVGNLFYQSKFDLPYHIRLDPGQVYTKIFQDTKDCQFIKATVFVKYDVGSPTRRWGSYEKTFDLEEIRDKVYQQPILRDEEE